MQPNNVHSVLALGDNFEYSLFRIAISFAENGTEVWFISPKPFEAAPKDLETPDKEILQLITFMYLKDYDDLVKQMNGIHLWRKIPNVIILAGYEHYCNFGSPEYNPLQAALITTSLLDSAAACAMKKNGKVNLLVACSENKTVDLGRLQVLKDLYFRDYIHKNDESEFVNQTMAVFK